MDLKDLQGNDINQFVKNYRESLQAQYDAGTNALNAQRKNDYASIMSGANKAGMMYSNFPQRSKIQYDTATYYPSVIRNYQTYQSGLDKLRANAINLFNQNKSIQEAIDDLNKA